jgi:tRNA dimethylallyltransferase
MIYKGMDIGTKPSAALLQQYPHQLIDFKDPPSRTPLRSSWPMRAGASKRHWRLAIARARRRYDVVFQGFQRGPGGHSGDIARCAVICTACTRGRTRRLWKNSRVDPVAASGIHPNNLQRLLRRSRWNRVRDSGFRPWAHQQRRRRECVDCRLIELTIEPPRARSRAQMVRFARMLDADPRRSVR